MTRKHNHLIPWNRDQLHFFFFFVFFAWKCDLLRLFRTHTCKGEGADCLSLTIWVSCIDIDAKGWRNCGQIILKPITGNQFPLQWIWDGKCQSLFLYLKMTYNLYFKLCITFGRVLSLENEKIGSCEEKRYRLNCW